MKKPKMYQSMAGWYPDPTPLSKKQHRALCWGAHHATSYIHLARPLRSAHPTT
jgi:hypothetical protein